MKESLKTHLATLVNLDFGLKWCRWALSVYTFAIVCCVSVSGPLSLYLVLCLGIWSFVSVSGPVSRYLVLCLGIWYTRRLSVVSRYLGEFSEFALRAEAVSTGPVCSPARRLSVVSRYPVCTGNQSQIQ